MGQVKRVEVASQDEPVSSQSQRLHIGYLVVPVVNESLVEARHVVITMDDQVSTIDRPGDTNGS